MLPRYVRFFWRPKKRISINHWNKIIPNWKNLQKYVDSSFMRLTLLIPLFGYLILFDANIMDSLCNNIAFSGAVPSERFTASSTIKYCENSTVHIKLYATYIGFCFLFLSNLIFRFRSPRQLSLSKDELDYIRDERELLNSSQVLFWRKIDQIDKELDLYRTGIRFSHDWQLVKNFRDLKRFVRSTKKKATNSSWGPEIGRDILLEYHYYVVNSMPISRFMVSLLFNMGTILIAFVSTHSFYLVMSRIWHVLAD